MKPKTIKIILTILLIVSGISDFFTFFRGNLQKFEINPIFIITQSYLALFLIKMLVLGGVIYLLWCYKPKKRFCYRANYKWNKFN